MSDPFVAKPKADAIAHSIAGIVRHAVSSTQNACRQKHSRTISSAAKTDTVDLPATNLMCKFQFVQLLQIRLLVDMNNKVMCKVNVNQNDSVEPFGLFE